MMDAPIINKDIAIPFLDKNALNVFTLEFKKSNLENLYRQERTIEIVRRTRFSVVLSFFMYLIYTSLMYFFESVVVLSSLPMHAWTIVFYLAIYALTHSKYINLYPQAFVMAAALFITSIILFSIHTGYENRSQYCYAGVGLCITWIIFMAGLRFINAISVIIAMLIEYNVFIYLNDFDEILSSNFFLIWNAVICMFAAYTLEKNLRLQFYQSIIIKNNSDTLHSAVIEASSDAVISIDESGCILDFNAAAEAMFDCTRQDAFSSQIDTLVVLSSFKGILEYFSGSENILAFGTQYKFEIILKNGKHVPIELTINSITLIGQKLMILYLRDVTEQQNANKEIARQREVLLRNERLSAMGSLLAGVAHELNNPLSVVVGQSQLLIETQHDARVLNRAEKIANAANRCAKVVSTFLAMARQQPLQRSNILINDLIIDALNLLEDGLHRDNIHIDLHLKEDMPYIFANSDQLHQVFTNIIVNAQQAMQASAVRKLTIQNQLGEDRSSIQIIFRDTGPGIPAHLHDRVFEPFFTTKSTDMGNGLGLAVCSGIIESHGGTIELSKSENEGACFVVNLPIDKSGNISPKSDITKTHAPSPRDILVVEDEDDIRELICEILITAGHSVKSARNGLEALAILESYSPHIIFTDLNMPTMNGIDFYARAIKMWAEYTERFVFIAGDLLAEEYATFLSNETLNIIEKPFQPRDLIMATYKSSFGNVFP